MKVLVTGAKGFIAKNLIAALENVIAGKDNTYHLAETISLYPYSRDMGKEYLRNCCKSCDFVFHLAGVNRPENPEDYRKGNTGFLKELLGGLESWGNPCPVMYASSIQAELDNEYGKSKKAGEELLLQYSQKNKVPVYIYRLSHVFGKWSKPNYNSVIATFCYNLARDLPIRIDEPEKRLSFLYIDDVVRELILLLKEQPASIRTNPCLIETSYDISLQEIASLIEDFKKARENQRIPNMKPGSFSQKLYSTYLTFLPTEKLKYSLVMNQDKRGSFTELFRTDERGQFSVNITRPGITKGEHWHHTKNEKFIVVSGNGLIRLRKIDSNHILDFYVSGEAIEVVDIPAGYTHNIVNTGQTDLITIMWASENFDRKRPDTFSLKVEEVEDEE
jgi:UDP-2-acetamido-2,6-beta-L-arabino-hexul-4-ose reductase